MEAVSATGGQRSSGAEPPYEADSAVASPSREKEPAFGHDGLSALLANSTRAVGNSTNEHDLLMQLASLIELISLVESSPDTEQGCLVLADRLQSQLNCEQVMVGLCRPPAPSCRVVASSGTAAVDANSERVRLAEGVLQESIARGDLSVWPATERNDRHALCAHRQFAEWVHAEAVLSVVLRDESGEVRGAWLMWGNQQIVQRPESVNFAMATQRPLAATLGLLVRCRQNRLQRLLSRARRLSLEHKAAAVLAIVVAVVGLFLVPVRYRVSCDCELQPVARRFVAAPFEGLLEQSLVEPGDVVAKNDVLAQMDAREIQWELAGAEAELHRASKEHAGHLAAHESGKAQIADDEVKRLTMRTELLRHRLEDLKILSPIDGIVVMGDLTKSEGAPLAVGQALFEIAPLKQMIVEVAIPEDDVRLVHTGLPIAIWLDAFPGRRWDAVVQKIHPRSELKNHENVFIAEVILENRESDLRPGMRGSSRIATVSRPLAWNLFHKAAARGMRWLGW